MCHEKNFSRRLEFGMFLMSQSHPDDAESPEFAEIMAKDNLDDLQRDWLEDVMSTDDRPIV